MVLESLVLIGEIKSLEKEINRPLVEKIGGRLRRD